jgi:hypothetical protein
MKANIGIFRNKVLIFAILFSATWHIFWLSAFTVVVVPKAKKVVKFSNISFLGPILEKGGLNVNMSTHEQTILEKKYLASIMPQPSLIIVDIARDEYVLPPLGITYSGNDEGLKALTVAKIDTDKIEPGRGVD